MRQSLTYGANNLTTQTKYLCVERGHPHYECSYSKDVAFTYTPQRCCEMMDIYMTFLFLSEDGKNPHRQNRTRKQKKKPHKFSGKRKHSMQTPDCIGVRIRESRSKNSRKPRNTRLYTMQCNCGDGGIDLTAVRKKTGFYFQCKRWLLRVGANVVDALFGAILREVRKEAVAVAPSFTEGARRAAESAPIPVILTNEDNVADAVLNYKSKKRQRCQRCRSRDEDSDNRNVCENAL